MKNTLKYFVIFFGMVLSLLSFPNKASAKEDLYIKDWIVDAYLMENGDLKISEDITFEFNNKYNGVYRDIVLDKTSGVENFNIQEVSSNNATFNYSQVKEAKNGDTGVYTLAEKNSKIQLKIYSPSKNEIKTFRISYLVKDVAIKYKDCGELYYKFLGKENKTFIGNFTVNINLPSADNSNKVKVYAHGPLNGKINQISESQYNLQVKDVATKTFIEGRVLFPREFIEKSINYHNVNRYHEIIEEETAYQNKIENDRIRKENNRKFFNKVTLYISAINLLIFIIVWYQSRRKVNRYTNNLEIRHIPEDCTPAVASYITGRYIDTNTFFATILDLFRKGYLKISGADESLELSKNNNFIIYKTRNEDISLLDHERYFMNWLFKGMGDGETISTKVMKDCNKYDPQKFYNSKSIWQKKIKEAADKKGYLDHSKNLQGSILAITSLISIVLGLITAIYGSVYAMLNFTLGIFLLIYSIYLFFRLSDKGYEQYKKWISFRKYMKKNNPSFYDGTDSSPDISLIYALALGIVKNDILNKNDDTFLTSSWFFWYILYASSSDNSFNDSINNSFAGSDSSFSSGAFSDGGGGGAGGGGAGGF